MCAIERKILHGCQLINKNIVKIDFHLKNNEYALLKGFVLSPIGEPLPNVAVQVTVVDEKCNQPKKNLIGITFSHKDGSYAISVPIGKGYLYEIVAYS